ncbi:MULTISPECIES: hypothetical protein [unclassified Clostridium]|uniref:hypothetical protein n=1 Tax=unclassified Clostridium TaxID=2614128 RepID=UPI0037C1709D
MLVNEDTNTKRYKKPFINNNKTIGAIIVNAFDLINNELIQTGTTDELYNEIRSLI